MRKMELVYLHELLALVREEYEQHLGHAVDCEAYDQLGVHPQALAHQKAEHDEAVRALARDLTVDLAEQTSSKTDSHAETPVSGHET
ncbi:UPF0058 family protein [Halobacterium yunchengense]|uniref:UPF0058 family protein n=1 Tax=Halobacterium yunchengense TaxID=3108497 RepID=UPI003008E3A0